MDEKDDLAGYQKPCKNDEIETRRIFNCWVLRVALWVAWFIGLMIWLD